MLGEKVTTEEKEKKQGRLTKSQSFTEIYHWRDTGILTEEDAEGGEGRGGSPAYLKLFAENQHRQKKKSKTTHRRRRRRRRR